MAAITTSTLARKYRPRTLADVVGQDNTIEQLEAAIKKKKFSSSYLFSGRTGCGKTTLALIIASYLGCSTGTACGKCPGCKAGRASPDFTHKDAATQGKVDDIRELMKLAQVSPMFGKRVIIIDECHMLTGQAANALLMTLEEPPENTVFILCTTEPEKLLPTIRNRCTHFPILDVPAPMMVKRMLKIIKKEKGSVDKEAVKPGLKSLAELADGSMRQALALLETVIDTDMSPEIIEKRFRASNKSQANLYEAAADVMAAVLEGDIAEAVKAIRKVDQRPLMYELTNLCDNVIAKMCGVSDSNTYSMRLLRERVKAKKLDIDIATLALYMARVSEIKYENLYKHTLQNITVVFIHEQSAND